MFKEELLEHISVFEKLLEMPSECKSFVDMTCAALSAGGKIVFAGNGGSASDAQHIATEFTVKYRSKRRALPAISLATDTSALTAIGNDFGFDQIFGRQLEAIGKRSDLLVLISTSGMSKNLLNCAKVANDLGISSFGLLGRDGGELVKICDASIVVPSETTSRIQEAHIFLLHFLIQSVEERMSLYE